MKSRKRYWHLLMSAGLAACAAQAASAAGFAPLSKHGEAVLTQCSSTDCKVTSLPGEPGYQLIAARSAPLIINDIAIGTVQEKVWRNQSTPQLYIFGLHVTVNAEQWDASGRSFNVNDLFRQTLPTKRVSVAYFLDGATKRLLASGRTIQGLNEFEEDQPERDNTWVDFRVDLNANDPDGVSSPSSPWLLTKTRAPEGFALNALGLRVLNSDVEDALDHVDFFTASYQPNGVPPPEDDGDDD